MRPVDDYTRERLGRPVATLCTCWRITRSDGIEIGLTDHDRDIVFTGTTFRSAIGGDGTALADNVSLAPDNSDIIGILSDEALGRADIDRGAYDDAQVDIWRVDWEDPSARLLLKSGTLGNIERSGAGYRAEFRSLKHYLDQVVGRLYGRTCDAALGDGRCGVNLHDTMFVYSGSLGADGDRELFVTGAGTFQSGWFDRGALVVESGTLAGFRASIRTHESSGGDAVIELWDAAPELISAGTSVSLFAGCDKQFSTCKAKFSNGLNFRGFPHIPGNDVLTIYPVAGDNFDGGAR